MGRGALERKSCAKVGLGGFRGPLEGRQSNCKDTQRLDKAMLSRTEQTSRQKQRQELWGQGPRE